MKHHTAKVLEAFFVHGAWRHPGDVIELGVGEGQTTAALAEAVGRAQLDKTVFGLDTFEGFPYSEGGKLTMGRLATSQEQVIKAFENHPGGNYRWCVELIPGMIEDTLFSLGDRQFCFAWVDMDLERPTRYAIRWLEDKIVPGGIIGFHDYGFFNTPGIKPAVDQEVNWNLYEKIKIAAINTLFIRRLS